MKVCDKFYVQADILEGQFFTMQNTIRNQDIQTFKTLALGGGGALVGSFMSHLELGQKLKF